MQVINELAKAGDIKKVILTPDRVIVKVWDNPEIIYIRKESANAQE